MWAARFAEAGRLIKEPTSRPESMLGFLRAAALGLLLASDTASCAQTAAIVDTVEQRGARLLTRVEGVALVDLALQYPASSRRLDCSHLVHHLLSTAGLAYPYATSFEIFAGIAQFRGVRSAQPGDLVVWPGHVGLVLDPQRSRFLSSTGGGVRTDDYRSDYWRRRSRPRFYRYVVSDTTQLAGLGDIPVPSRETIPPRAALVAKQSSKGFAESESSPPATSNSVVSYDIPQSIQIVAEHGKPTRDDVEGAVSELANSSVSLLDAENRTQMPVVLLRDLKIREVHIKGDKGWASVRVNSRVELYPDGTWKKVRAHELRCELRRGQEGWVIFMPRDRLYVPENVAIPVLAKQLSALSAAPARLTRPRQLGSLAAVLNVLLNED